MTTFIKLTRARFNADSSGLEPQDGTVARYNVARISKYDTPLVWAPITSDARGQFAPSPVGSLVYAVDANPDGDYVMESPDEIDALIRKAGGHVAE